MERDIKCAECGKITRHFELGELIYCLEEITSIKIRNQIFCPKCGIDISNQKCLLKENEIMIVFLAINIVGDTPPKHLRGVYPLDKKDFQKIKFLCKATPKLVKKF